MNLKDIIEAKPCGITFKKPRRNLINKKEIKSFEHLNESSLNYEIKIMYKDNSSDVLKGSHEQLSKLIEFF